MRNHSGSDWDSAVPLLLSQFCDRPAPGLSSQSFFLCSRPPVTLLPTMSSYTELSVISLVTVLAGFPVIYRIKYKCLRLAYKFLRHLAAASPASEVSPLSPLLWPHKRLIIAWNVASLLFYKPSHLHELLLPSNSNYPSHSILWDPVQMPPPLAPVWVPGRVCALVPMALGSNPCFKHLVFHVVPSPALPWASVGQGLFLFHFYNVTINLAFSTLRAPRVFNR